MHQSQWPFLYGHCLSFVDLEPLNCTIASVDLSIGMSDMCADIDIGMSIETTCIIIEPCIICDPEASLYRKSTPASQDSYLELERQCLQGEFHVHLIALLGVLKP